MFGQLLDISPFKLAESVSPKPYVDSCSNSFLLSEERVSSTSWLSDMIDKADIIFRTHIVQNVTCTIVCV